MKVLDRYILNTYLKTFISVFLILMLIFILQTIWLYIKELAGKDLDLMIVGKFLMYFMPKLIPLVVPLTILLSSIMVFGSFAENYEFAAMKSTGISLQRSMSGLSIFIVVLAFMTFWFSNNVIPWAELNSYNLRRNIAKLKPAMAIAEGQFNEIMNYNIKVEKKSGDKGQFLEDVTIHIKGSDGRKNATTIKSKTGELASSKDSEVLKLILYDGNYYSDVTPSKAQDKKKVPFAKSTFEKYIINIDLSKMNEVDLDEQSQTDKYNMLSINGLSKAIDSLEKRKVDDHKSLAKILLQRSTVIKNPNTKTVKDKATEENIKRDSIYSGEILDLFNTRKKVELVDAAARRSVSVRQIISSKKATLKKSKEWLNKHYISLYEKFALGFACIILFFVGAPLGALIRKGGIGLPMVVAILLFLTYHFIGIFATNSAKNGSFNPILASWFSTLVMLPLGITLTRRATADRGLFEMGSISEPLRKIFKIKEKNGVDYKFLNSLTNQELFNIIKNYETLGHEEGVRYEAIQILKSKGIDSKALREYYVEIDNSFDSSESITDDYHDHSKFAIILYSIGAVLLVLFFIFRNNKLPSLASASIQLSIVSFTLFIVYYIKSIINTFQFYRHINKREKKLSIFFLILGIPLYMIAYPFLRVKVKEDLRLNCLESLK
ncbi:LptF/LptG family permease [Seonamhaeicola maritimus]|uniref:YjgP/YjgQ family permease n=1 Tax=Seonamhaeicola maritimus TaxID=2591822 RepID=A0A5C7GM41_9FLAO|nr:LptF/LptG family permease [Seonamhaeicola maritimus]TXG39599.1 YjgP/YjgQ family permease [Seonamhaeicola maritimus]